MLNKPISKLSTVFESNLLVIKNRIYNNDVNGAYSNYEFTILTLDNKINTSLS